MPPIWAWFGYDEPNYTYMKDGKKLLSEIAKLSPVPVYVRAHCLLCTGDGTPALKWGSTNAYTEDANGNPIYNWRIIDSIFDTYIQRGMKPLAQIGFMPKALSAHPEPYQHDWKPGEPYSKVFTGWAYPPKDYNKWQERYLFLRMISLQGLSILVCLKYLIRGQGGLMDIKHHPDYKNNKWIYITYSKPVDTLATTAIFTQ